MTNLTCPSPVFIVANLKTSISFYADILEGPDKNDIMQQSIFSP
jgi:hypothetical protein